MMRIVFISVVSALVLIGVGAHQANATRKGCITVQEQTVCGADIPDNPTPVCTDASSCDAGANSDPQTPSEAPPGDDPVVNPGSDPPAGDPPASPEAPIATGTVPAGTTSTAVTPVVQVVPDACVNLPGEKTMRPDWAKNTDGTCSPPPQHGLYCHVVDGAWKMEDLVRDQEIMDSYWIIQGPWRDAYDDPVTGSASCDFPPDPVPATQPVASVVPPIKTNPVIPAPPVFQRKAAKAQQPSAGQAKNRLSLPAVRVIPAKPRAAVATPVQRLRHPGSIRIPATSATKHLPNAATHTSRTLVLPAG